MLDVRWYSIMGDKIRKKHQTTCTQAWKSTEKDQLL